MWLSKAASKIVDAMTDGVKESSPSKDDDNVSQHIISVVTNILSVIRETKQIVSDVKSIIETLKQDKQQNVVEEDEYVKESENI